MQQHSLLENILLDQAETTVPPKGAVMQRLKTGDAIFRLSVKTISRSQGRSVLFCAAYRAGCKIVAEDGSLIADYRPRKGVLFSRIIAPSNSPEWAFNRNELWLRASSIERRNNSVEAREFEVAIPNGIDQEAAIKLADEFATEIVSRHRCVVDFSLHADSRKNWDGTQKNFDGLHVHFLLTTRRLSQEGFGEKTRELDIRGSGEVTHWRERWATLANVVFDKKGMSTRIDHRSNQLRGIDRDPSRPLGHKIVAVERRGKRTVLGNHLRALSCDEPSASYSDPSE
ncbi:MAG: MobA/MobL family protein [Janthinobacterium lividum]